MPGLNFAPSPETTLPAGRQQVWGYPELRSHSLLVLTFDRLHLAPLGNGPAFEALARSSPYFNDIDTSGELLRSGGWLALRGRIKQARFGRIYDLQGTAATNTLFQMLRPFPPVWSGPASGAKLRHRNPDRDRMHMLERHAEQLRVAGIWPDAPTTPGDAPGPDLSWILRRAK